MRMEILETKRLVLRPWQESDAGALFKYASDPDVGPRAGWPPHKSVEESLEIIRTVFSGEGMWAVELKETREPCAQWRHSAYLRTINNPSGDYSSSAFLADSRALAVPCVSISETVNPDKAFSNASVLLEPGPHSLIRITALK